VVYGIPCLAEEQSGPCKVKVSSKNLIPLNEPWIGLVGDLVAGPFDGQIGDPIGGIKCPRNGDLSGFFRKSGFQIQSSLW
jgi:hypothetical protein